MALEGLNALREVSQLSVDVSELLRQPGTSRHLKFTEEIDGLGLDMGRIRPVLDFSVELSGLVEGILVSGQVRGVYVLECIRCVKEFETPFEVELGEILAYESHPVADDGYQIAGDHALLEPVV